MGHGLDAVHLACPHKSPAVYYMTKCLEISSGATEICHETKQKDSTWSTMALYTTEAGTSCCGRAGSQHNHLCETLCRKETDHHCNQPLGMVQGAVNIGCDVYGGIRDPIVTLAPPFA